MSPASDLVVLAADRAAPQGRLLTAYLDLTQLLLCGGRERTAAEYRAMLTQAGLTVTGDQDAPGRPGIRVLVARRA